MSVGYHMLRHHGAMYRAIASLLLHSAIPRKRPPSSAAAATTVQRIIRPPAPALVARYIDWCGAQGRYQGELPPHMVSQWSLPLVGKLLLQLPYKLASVINQGVSLRVNGALPRGVRLHVQAALESVEEVDGRAKVTVSILTGTAQQPDLVEARLYMSFILPGPRPARSALPRPPEPRWQAVGSWQADARDGLRFALLTGDFNPIHWSSPLARRSVFKGKVLHGFGSLVRTYETLQPGVLKGIEVRFVKPVPLPSGPLQVELAAADATDRFPLRLTSQNGAVLHLIGHCLRCHN